MRRILIALFALSLSLPAVGFANSYVSRCRIEDVPRRIGPDDRLYLTAGGYCGPQRVKFSLERLGGPHGNHLVEISTEFRALRARPGRQRPVVLGPPASGIIIIDPIGRLEVNARYRLTVQAIRQVRYDFFNLSPKSWVISQSIQLPLLGNLRATQAAYADFRVAPRPEKEKPKLEPAITGQRLGTLEGVPVARVCVSSAGLPKHAPHHRYLYVVENLRRDGRWTWLSAWHPKDFGTRDLRCAYIVSTLVYPPDWSAPNELTLRPMVIRSDGVRWTGPVRRISLPKWEPPGQRR